MRAVPDLGHGGQGTSLERASSTRCSIRRGSTSSCDDPRRRRRRRGTDGPGARLRVGAQRHPGAVGRLAPAAPRADRRARGPLGHHPRGSAGGPGGHPRLDLHADPVARRPGDPGARKRPERAAGEADRPDRRGRPARRGRRIPSPRHADGRPRGAVLPGLRGPCRACRCGSVGRARVVRASRISDAPVGYRLARRRGAVRRHPGRLRHPRHRPGERLPRPGRSPSPACGSGAAASARRSRRRSNTRAEAWRSCSASPTFRPASRSAPSFEVVGDARRGCGDAPDAGDAFAAQARYFVECVEGGVPPARAPVAAAVDALRVALAARESARTGERIVLPSDDASAPPHPRVGWARERQVVAVGGRLSGLSAEFRGQRRRRHRRPAGHHPAPRLPQAARRRRGLALAHLRVAARRQRLRHQRLPGDRPAVRHVRRLRRAAGGTARARHEARHGPRRQSHVRRAPVVHRVGVLHRQPEARLVLVASAARRPAAGGARAPSRTTGAPSSRVRPGSSTRRPASTTSTSSRASSPTSTGRTRRCGTPSTT